ncbi:S-dihydroxybenzoyltransferase [Arthrobotrys entomopaga]|nr:S-dihydroxybenzoyltransferase [Arthrobotrys entomopaga]
MPVESIFPAVDIPDVDIYTLMFDRSQKNFPDDQVMLVDAKTGRELTYSECASRSRDLGIGLKTLWGWKKGDVMAVFTFNNVESPLLCWGVMWAGGVLSPANPGYTLDEFVYQLKNCEAKAVTCQAETLPLVRQAAKQVGIPEDRILILGDTKVPGFKHLNELKNMSHREVKITRRPKFEPAKDIAFLVYSSGTTGLPKGVMLSHRNIVANILQGKAVEGRKLKAGEDSILGFLPFFHIYGLQCIMHTSFYLGVKLVIMERFDLEKFCQLIEKYKITFVYVVPPVILGLAKHPIVSKYDLSSIKMMNSGAAPLTSEIQEAIYNRLKIKTKQGYGLSETSPTTHAQAWEDWKDKIGSVGQLLPNLTAKYVGEDGEEVKAGETGELWLKGPNIMMGYWKNPEATANCMTEDGYFKTGDVGHQDKDGNFYITDRVKELIKYKGFQVPPAELEGKIASHPKVDDVAVTGVWEDSQHTEVPRAYIVLAAGNQPTPEVAQEIIDFVAKNVAHHKKLRGGVKFVDVIPKSASGKILRRVLKDQAKAEKRKEGAKL